MGSQRIEHRVTRRYRSTGKFRDAPPLASAPLFEAFARPAKSAPHVRAAATRAARHRARVLAVAAVLRAGARNAQVPF